MSFTCLFHRWRPILGVDAILLSVLSMLDQPNVDSPANVDAAVNFSFTIHQCVTLIIRFNTKMTMKATKRRLEH